MIDLAFAALRSSVLILVGLLGFAIFLRGRSAAVRHHALRVLLVTATFLPFAASIFVFLPRPAAVTVPAQTVQAAPIWFPPTALPEGSYRLRSPAYADPGQDFQAHMVAIAVASAIQVAGAFLFAFPAQRATRRLRRIESTAVPLDAFEGIPVLRATDPELRVPVAYGRSGVPASPQRAAKILLPATSECWPEARLQAALLHEAAHVRRGDWTWIQYARGIAVFYWYSPAFFLLVSALRATAEGAADDAVVAAGVRPSDYARELLAVAARTSGLDAAAVAMVGRGGLRSRIAAILAPRRDRRRATIRFGAAAGAILGLMGLGLASLGARMERLAVPMPSGAVETDHGEAKFSDDTELFLLSVQDVTMDRIVAWNKYGGEADTSKAFPWSTFRVGPNAGYMAYAVDLFTSDPSPGVAFRLPAAFKGQASTMLGRPGAQEFHAFVVTPHFETPALSGDLAVGVATGTWQSVEVRPLSQERRHIDMKRRDVVEIELPSVARDTQFRAVAYSDAGRRLPPNPDYAQSQDTEGDRPHAGFGVRLAPSERVGRVVVEYRPYHWAVFRDVSLHPGRDALATAHRPRLKRNVFEHGGLVDYTVLGEAGR